MRAIVNVHPYLQRQRLRIDHASELPTIDLNGPASGVDVTIRSDGGVIWVNIDGVCILRVSDAPVIVVNDEREKVAK